MVSCRKTLNECGVILNTNYIVPHFRLGNEDMFKMGHKAYLFLLRLGLVVAARVLNAYKNY